jgi:anti-sigma B factor antagonist
MNIHTQVGKTGSTLVQFQGDLDVATNHYLHDAGTLALTNPSCVELLLDLSEVTFIDSTGLNSLVRLRNAAIKRGTRLALVSPSPWVTRILDLTSLAGLFEVHTESESLNS